MICGESREAVDQSNGISSNASSERINYDDLGEMKPASPIPTDEDADMSDDEIGIDESAESPIHTVALGSTPA